jgi:hypothetical protein
VIAECVTYDFSSSDGGFYTVDCGGASVWEWGQMPGPIQDCDGGSVEYALATVVSGQYPANAGEAAVIGPVAVTSDCSCLEICHTYDFEPGVDGGNVKVSADGGASWDLVSPARAYDFAADAGTACLPQESVFSESASPIYRDCFDLSDYIGSDVLIGFFFGSNASQHEFGWYVLWAKLGTDKSPVEPTSWGTIKALYR